MDLLDSCLSAALGKTVCPDNPQLELSPIGCYRYSVSPVSGCGWLRKQKGRSKGFLSSQASEGEKNTHNYPISSECLFRILWSISYSRTMDMLHWLMQHVRNFTQRIRRRYYKDLNVNKTARASTRPRLWRGVVDTVEIERTAHGQTQSSFFGRLPLEIRRMIYLKVVRNAGFRQHIFFKDNAQLRHTPCLAPSLADLDKIDRKNRRDLYGPDNRWGMLHHNCLLVAECACSLSEPCQNCRGLMGGERAAIHPLLFSCKRM